MKLGKYNAEGYYDPTAFEGISNADTNKLKITYPTGYMELNLDKFFPCTLDKARKVFSLIHRYSSESDKDRLQAFLKEMEKEFETQMVEYAEKAMSYPSKSKEYSMYMSKFKEVRRFRQRIIRNIELFITGRKQI